MTDTSSQVRITSLHDDAQRTTATIRVLAREWDRANGDEDFPVARLHSIAASDGLGAFVELTTSASVKALTTALRLIGGADLGLGRIYEGHVNAAQLVHAYGTGAQREALAAGNAAGRVLGVWNTEPVPGMTIVREPDCWRLSGAKSFATGGGHIDGALITARDEAGAKQLVLVDIAEMVGRADNSSWQVRGMRGTCSGLFNFDGLLVDERSIIGAPGDYELEPRFSAGAWRFTAVQLGATEALVRHLRDHLVATGKGTDPIQRARFAACVAATRSAGLWVAHAAQVAEAGGDDAIPLVLMTRGIVEDAAFVVMEAAARGVGTASFFAGSRIDRITRDLGLYLRQPVPDQARDRAAAAWLEADRWGEDCWW